MSTTFWRTLPLLLLVLACLILGATWLWPHPLPADPLERAQLFDEAGHSDDAVATVRAALASSPDDLGLNRLYVRLTHGDTAPVEKKARSDNGLYCLGYAASLRNDNQVALRYFRQVHNRRLRYLNISMGVAYLELELYDQGQACLWAEIDAHRDVQYATADLVKLYEDRADLRGMSYLISNPTTSPYVLAEPRWWLALRQGSVWQYLVAMGMETRQWTVLAWCTSLVLGGLWLALLWRLSGAVVLIPLFALAALTTQTLTHAGYALMQALDPVVQNTDNVRYVILHVGLVEESIKLLPVLLALPCLYRTRDPMVLVAAGATSALAFATVENAEYLTETPSMAVLWLRFLHSVFGHVITTTLVCYALARARTVGRGYGWVGAAFGVAILVHALFDFKWHIEPIMAWLEALLLGRMLGNALSLSRAPSREARVFNHRLIGMGTIVLCVTGFLAVNSAWSTSLAWADLRATWTTATLGVAAYYRFVADIRVGSHESWWPRLRRPGFDQPDLPWPIKLMALWGMEQVFGILWRIPAILGTVYLLWTEGRKALSRRSVTPDPSSGAAESP